MTEYEHLSERQLARVNALDAARNALSAKTVISAGAVDAIDLITVAEYIERGPARYAPEPETATDTEGDDK